MITEENTAKSNRFTFIKHQAGAYVVDISMMARNFRGLEFQPQPGHTLMVVMHAMKTGDSYIPATYAVVGVDAILRFLDRLEEELVSIQANESLLDSLAEMKTVVIKSKGEQ